MSNTKLILRAVANPNDGLFTGEAQVTAGRYSIGRAHENDWVLSDAKRTVSKRHCSIVETPQGFKLTDSSTNGTTVNGRAVDRNNGHILRDGDEIGIGAYQFQANVQTHTDWRAMSSGSGQPQITAILHDVAPAGVTAKGVLPGDTGAFDIALTPRSGAVPQSIGYMGWNAPPDPSIDVVKTVDPFAGATREISNRSEQLPVHSSLVDLPKPKQIIPDDWFLETNSPAGLASDSGAARHPIIPPNTEPIPTADSDNAKFTVIPVDNIDVGVDFSVPPATSTPVGTQMPHPRQMSGAPHNIATQAMPSAHPSNAQSNLIGALLEGAGAPAGQHIEDPLRFLHNVGRLLAIAVTELHNLQKAGTRSAALLELNDASAAQTPWIFSLSGDDQSQLVPRVVEFIAESEPRDLEQIRGDFRQNATQLNTISQAITGLLENIGQKVSYSNIDQHAGASGKILPALRKAALWESMLMNSGLYSVQDNKIGNVNLFQSLRDEYKKALRDNGNL